jgi:hypothetical protein
MQNQRNPNSQNKPMVKIGGLYENQSKANGNTYFSGRFGYGARILVLKNPDKTPDSPLNVPHWNIFILEDTPKPDAP